MAYKKYTLLILSAIVLFVAANFIIWKTVTEDLITDTNFDGGDLARMGYVPDSKMNRKNVVDLPKQHIRFKHFEGGDIDLITVGDSFSQGGGGGKNRFYQDYIATLNNMNVLSLDEYRNESHISIISILNNNGFIDQLKPKYVLIGATERAFKEMATGIDFNRSISMTDFKKLAVKDHYQGLPRSSFINNGNIKFIIDYFSFKFRDHAEFSDVHAAETTREFFSVKNSRKLLYLPNYAKINADDVNKLNQNMNLLADRLRKKGVQLIYMPYVDKYTLYSPWLLNKKLPESNFFELLRPLPKKYIFIDTKALLREELERGEKDIFYADDTHSSWKASEKIFSIVRFRPDGE